MEGVDLDAFDLTARVVSSSARSTHLSTRDGLEFDVIPPPTLESPFLPSEEEAVSIAFLSTAGAVDPIGAYDAFHATIGGVMWLDTVQLNPNIEGDEGRVFPSRPDAPEHCVGVTGYDATVGRISFDGDEGTFLLGVGEERAFHLDGVPFVAQVFRAEIIDGRGLGEGLVRRLAE